MVLASVEHADLALVDVLGRLQLDARRAGVRLHLHGATPALAQLLDLVGLLEVLPCRERSAVERGRQPEPGEEGGVEEVVDVRDPAS